MTSTSLPAAVARSPRSSGGGASLIVVIACLAWLVGAAREATAAAPQQQIQLRSGWNLISINVKPPDSSVSAVLSQLITSSTLQALWTYDAASGEWSAFASPPAGAPLPAGIGLITQIQPGRGYWLKVTSTQTLTILGQEGQVPGSPPPLSANWNLIGVTLDSAQPYQDVLSGLPISEIWTYDATAGAFKGIVLSGVIGSPTLQRDFQNLVPGLAYWVKSTGGVSLNPVLGTAARGDVDVAPFLKKANGDFLGPNDRLTGWMLNRQFSPGDNDFGDDGIFDPPTAQRGIGFGEDSDLQSVSIFNTGSNVLNWSASVSDPGVPSCSGWLKLRTLDPILGDLVSTSQSGAVGAAQTDTIDLLVDRTGCPPGHYTATLVIGSNGETRAYPEEPNRTFTVSMDVARLDGDYRVLAKIDSINGEPGDTANPRLFLSLYEDADGFKAVIDAKRTLLVPDAVRMAGAVYVANSNKLIVSGSLALEADDEDNPYDVKIRRDFTLVADRRSRPQAGGTIDPVDATLGPLDLRGTYYETIRGVLAQPIFMVGTFTATRLGPDPTAADSIDKPTPGGAGNIPDDGQGNQKLVRTIHVDDRMILTEVDVKLTSTHTRPEDLVIEISSPGNETVTLRDRTSDPLGTQTFDEDATPVEPLSNFVGSLSQGDWTLTIDDVTPGETGNFVDVRLLLKGTRIGDISGTIGGVGAGATVLLTGCGMSLTTTTDASGHYQFTNLVDCLYRVTVHKSGFVRSTLEVSLNGSSVTNANLAPAPATPDAPIVVVLPGDQGCSSGCFAFASLTTAASAGSLLPTAQTRNAADSATFDIDRQPLGPTTPGAEDTNQFLGGSPSATTGTNLVGFNNTIDPAVSAPGAKSHRVILALGGPVIGASESGSDKLAIGANP